MFFQKNPFSVKSHINPTNPWIRHLCCSMGCPWSAQCIREPHASTHQRDMQLARFHLLWSHLMHTEIQAKRFFCTVHKRKSFCDALIGPVWQLFTAKIDTVLCAQNFQWCTHHQSSGSSLSCTFDVDFSLGHEPTDATEQCSTCSCKLASNCHGCCNSLFLHEGVGHLSVVRGPSLSKMTINAMPTSHCRWSTSETFLFDCCVTHLELQMTMAIGKPLNCSCSLVVP